MRNLTVRLNLVAVGLALTAVWQSPVFGTDTDPNHKTVTILQLNDVYQISPVEKGKRGGLARVATLRKKFVQENPNTWFMVAGDFISPSLATHHFEGRHMISVLDAAGVDLVTLGNHEFDLGTAALRARMKESKFKWVISNVTEPGAQSKAPFGGAEKYVIRDFGGPKVAVVGLLLEETRNMSKAAGEAKFEPVLPAAKRVLTEVKKKKPDAIIGLTHLNMSQDQELARKNQELNLVLGGHDHELLSSHAGRAPILKMGSDAKWLGKIDLHFAKRGTHWELESTDWRAIPVTDEVAEDPDVAKVVADYENKLNEGLKEVIAKSEVELNAKVGHVRWEESILGDWIADAYRDVMQADVGIITGGGIRSDMTYPPGDITRKDVANILPFGNKIAKARITGAHLKKLLETGVSRSDHPNGGFPQVSGMAYEFDISKPVGSRVTRIEVGGSPLVPEKKYVIAMPDYYFRGGDGFDLAGAEPLMDLEAGPLDAEVFASYLKKKGVVAGKTDGRIVRK